MNPDGPNVEIIGHNYRNSYEPSVTSWATSSRTTTTTRRMPGELGDVSTPTSGSRRTTVTGVAGRPRPGQTVPVAEWRQDDPGMAPTGDVYGGGSPTGNVFYENGALGPSWEGTFFPADAGRNEVFAYKPARDGAGFALDRKVFFTSNVKQQYAGSDFVMGTAGVTNAIATLFRPSDIAVGPDGALYVSDWIDARVGRAQGLDRRVRSDIPDSLRRASCEVTAFDAATIDGQITALRSRPSTLGDWSKG